MAEKEIETFDGLWKNAWLQFRKGKHTKRPPTEEGVYPIWAQDGTFRGYATAELQRGILHYRVYSFSSPNPKAVHVGWWWSMALPSLPTAPDWDEQEGGDPEDNDGDGDDTAERHEMARQRFRETVKRSLCG